MAHRCVITKRRSPGLCSGGDGSCSFRVTDSPFLPGTCPVLALKVLCPKKPLSPGHTGQLVTRACHTRTDQELVPTCWHHQTGPSQLFQGPLKIRTVFPLGPTMFCSYFNEIEMQGTQRQSVTTMVFLSPVRWVVSKLQTAYL